MRGLLRINSLKYLALVVTSVLILAGFMDYGFPKSQPIHSEVALPVLRVGAVPAESKEKTRDQFEKFMNYLGRKTGCIVELYVADNYEGIIDKMRQGDLDIAWFGPFSYVIAAETAGARAFAIDDNIKNGTVYHSVFITHSESGIDSIEKIKGHTFAFVDQASTSGYLIPKSILQRHGIDPLRDFAKVEFAGSHDAAILAVKKRQIDAAAVSDAILASLSEKGIVGEKELQMIGSSEAIPTSTWAYRDGIAAELLAKIRQAFFSIAAEDREALGMYGNDLVKGFVPTDDKQYDIIRNIAENLGLGSN
ncbi:MAG TPA: phosphate/phosphite/phosphonate ABC transporter substrate-binding protein [Methylomusa anaerophila]|uniref:Phosphate-import protein PhnD n=1 Tax=Methylomusa anaerophila TaxID=1930071 RepID=A0A348AFP5_9FIRM|nr:phosphate/phosphite/phosphonate ABC transporter substrate-binding protein [Methylomusa anaerophila]BBB89893.1 phosphate-import protein PhnD precursor [Methylomusa anaerophila]HML90553.1 phosphate/phosphite/phosphonate ABC transporter substrate-binding protein [Methylomusa anaerophila]